MLIRVEYGKRLLWGTGQASDSWHKRLMELVIFVGLQATGKTSFYRSYFAETHTLVSKDLLRNSRNRQARQLALIEQALRSGRSVVVDNTNPRVEDRAPLIELGKAFGARIIGYMFEGSVSECMRRNALREGHARVPDIAIYSIAARLEHPVEGESFDSLFRVRLGESGFEVRSAHSGKRVVQPAPS